MWCVVLPRAMNNTAAVTTGNVKPSFTITYNHHKLHYQHQHHHHHLRAPVKVLRLLRLLLLPEAAAACVGGGVGQALTS